MNLIPYSITNAAGSADTTINNLTKFRSKLIDAPLIQSGKPRFTRRGDGQESDLAGVFMDGVVIGIMFTCLDVPVGDGFDDLAALWKKDKTNRTLIFKDSDASDRQWYVTGRCLGLGPAKGKNVSAFFALKSETLLTVTTETESTWTISALPASQAFTIDIGNDDAFPIFDISPGAVGSAGQRYCRFCTTYNYTRQAASMYHIEISNGGLDTTALINFTAISLQVNNGAGYDAVATTIAYDTVTGTLPAVPFMLYRAGEQLRVTARTGTTSGNLTVVRGVHGSVATTHADNAVLALSKAAFDGRDVRVMTGNGNGVLKESPFWFGTGANAWNQAATKIWIPNTYAARQLGTLSADITDSDTSLTLEDDEGDIDPTDGILLLESELVTYTNYSRATGAATNLIRAAKGTSAAAHTAGITVRALSDIWLYYGSASATAPVYADDLKPVFALTSTNNSWTYLNFALGIANLIDEWKAISTTPTATTKTYSTDRDYTNIAPSNPVAEIGVALLAKGASAEWQLTCPFGYTSGTATNVDRFNLPASQGYLAASDGTQQVVAATTALNTWQTTASLVLTPAITSYICRFYLKNTKTTAYPRIAAMNMESIVMALSTATTSTEYGRPFVSLGSEQAVEYDLDLTLGNSTTGESIRIIKNDVAASQILRVDTLQKKITYLKDNSNCYSSLQAYPARENWLRMIQGSNTLTCNSNNLSIVVKWQGRNNSFG